MDIKTREQDGVTVIEISGSLDANTMPQAQEVIMPLVVPDALLILDMTSCNYVSSAGLRLLLMIAKTFKTAKGGKGCLAGLSDEVKDVMEMTGFAHFFKDFKTVQDAVKAIKELS